MKSKGTAVNERGIRKDLEGCNPGVTKLLFGKLGSKDSQLQLRLMIPCCVISGHMLHLLSKSHH